MRSRTDGAAIRHVGDITSCTKRLVGARDDDATNRVVGHEFRNGRLKALLDRGTEGIHSLGLVEPQQGDVIPVFDDYRVHVSLPAYKFAGSGHDIDMRHEMKLNFALEWNSREPEIRQRGLC